MTEKIGIKDTKEAMIGCLEMGLLIYHVSKDGLQFSDPIDILRALSSDPRFLEAAKGLTNIKKEVSDLDPKEITELVKVFVSYIPKYIDEISS